MDNMGEKIGFAMRLAPLTHTSPICGAARALSRKRQRAWIVLAMIRMMNEEPRDNSRGLLSSFWSLS